MRLQTIALAALIAVAAPAFAKRVNITSFSPGSTDVKISFNSVGESLSLRQLTAEPVGTYTVEAGQLSGYLDGASFSTYCAEALAPVDWGDPNRPISGPEYDQLPTPPQFGSKRAGDLSRLFTAASSFVTDAATSAAFQAAVWEIIYEKGTYPHYDLNTGSFMGEAVNHGDADAFSGINGVLANLGSYGKAYRVDVLVSEQWQDYLVVTSIPEPGTLALLASGLGALAFVARRRNRQRD